MKDETKKGTRSARNRRRVSSRRGHVHVGSYVFSVAKTIETRQLKKKVSLTKETISALDDWVNKLLQDITKAAMGLARYNQKKSIGLREIRGAMVQVIPNDLLVDALREAERAYVSFQNSYDAERKASVDQ